MIAPVEDTASSDRFRIAALPWSYSCIAPVPRVKRQSNPMALRLLHSLLLLVLVSLLLPFLSIPRSGIVYPFADDDKYRHRHNGTASSKSGGSQSANADTDAATRSERPTPPQPRRQERRQRRSLKASGVAFGAAGSNVFGGGTGGGGGISDAEQKMRDANPEWPYPAPLPIPPTSATATTANAAAAAAATADNLRFQNKHHKDNYKGVVEDPQIARYRHARAVAAANWATLARLSKLLYDDGAEAALCSAPFPPWPRSVPTTTAAAAAAAAAGTGAGAGGGVGGIGGIGAGAAVGAGGDRAGAGGGGGGGAGAGAGRASAEAEAEGGPQRIRWLHAPKTGSGFVNTVLRYGCPAVRDSSGVFGADAVHLGAPM